jgi:hypothetical protein
MIIRVAAALVAAVLALTACDADDGASVRDLGGSASSGSGSGTGVASGSGTEAGGECEPSDGAEGLSVALDEFKLVPAEEELTSGPTRFLASNAGEVEHELVIVQSPNIAALPLDGDNGVDMDALDPARVIAEIEEIPPGETCALEVDLEPATYVLFCNIVDEGENKPRSHYLRGMRNRVKVL